MAIDQEKLEELKAKYGSGFVLTFPASAYDEEVNFVVKRPPKGEFKRFQTLRNDNQRTEALETLAKVCIVHPEGGELTKLLDERPGLTELVGAKLVDIGSSERQADAKKL